MNETTVIPVCEECHVPVDEQEGVRCANCDTDDEDSPGYNDRLDPDQQVTAEEEIAAVIDRYQEHFKAKHGLDEMPFGEEDCAELGRRILLVVLQEFRPDLIAGADDEEAAE